MAILRLLDQFRRYWPGNGGAARKTKPIRTGEGPWMASACFRIGRQAGPGTRNLRRDRAKKSQFAGSLDREPVRCEEAKAVPSPTSGDGWDWQYGKKKLAFLPGGP
jgi:hypothetical protein